MIRLKKVKLTNTDRLNIEYEKENKMGGWDEYAFTCSDKARPEFYGSMQALALHVVEMCELPKNYLTKCKVRGITFSYGGKKEVMGATITAQMELVNSNSDLNLNTPHKASDSYSDIPADEKQLLTDDCINALDKLCNESILYINGDRAQTKLFSIV